MHSRIVGRSVGQSFGRSVYRLVSFCVYVCMYAAQNEFPFIYFIRHTFVAWKSLWLVFFHSVVSHDEFFIAV